MTRRPTRPAHPCPPGACSQTGESPDSLSSEHTSLSSEGARIALQNAEFVYDPEPPLLYR